MGSVQQLITIPFEDAFNTLKAAKSPKKLYFLMGSDHYLQKFFIDKIYDKISIENNVQKVFLTLFVKNSYFWFYYMFKCSI